MQQPIDPTNPQPEPAQPVTPQAQSEPAQPAPQTPLTQAAPSSPQPAAQPAPQPKAAQPAPAAYEPAQPACPAQPVPQQTTWQQPYSPAQEIPYAPAPQDPYQASRQPYQQQPYQQPHQQPPYPQQAAFAASYPMSDYDRTLRMIAFILNMVSLAVSAILIVPLAWMIPMCITSWRIYKGARPNTVAFGVCTLIFLSLFGGILLLLSKKDR